MFTYAHYLITRFNLTVNYGIKGLNAQKNIDYLNQRFELFEKYTLPSVIGQTNQNFKWLVFFDSETPQIYKDKVTKYVEQCPVMTPLYLTAKEAYKYFDWLNDYIGRDLSEWYITSRVDNDDSLGKDYIENVQKYIAKNQPQKEYLYFSRGVQYDEPRKLCCSVYDPVGHFGTLVYPKCEYINTVMNYEHDKIAELFTSYDLDQGNLMWIEVVHGTNCGNQSKYSLKTRLGNDKYIYDNFNVIIRTSSKLVGNVKYFWLIVIRIVKNRVGRK